MLLIKIIKRNYRSGQKWVMIANKYQYELYPREMTNTTICEWLEHAKRHPKTVPHELQRAMAVELMDRVSNPGLAELADHMNQVRPPR